MRVCAPSPPRRYAGNVHDDQATSKAPVGEETTEPLRPASRLQHRTPMSSLWQP